MIVKEVYGDIFEVAEIHGCGAIAHGCNVYGKMGAGIAKAIRAKSNYNYQLYKDACLQALREGVDITGSFVGTYFPENNLVIFNLFTQDFPGPHARLEWIEESITEVVNSEFAPQKLCIPKIGCGIGGLKWDDVRNIIESIDSETEVVVAYI